MEPEVYLFAFQVPFISDPVLLCPTVVRKSRHLQRRLELGLSVSRFSICEITCGFEKPSP